MIESILQFLLPLLCATVALLYFRRASIGLERHLRNVSYGFFVVAVFELLSLSSMFRGSKDIWIFELVAAYGIVNILTYIVLLIATLILAKWTWYYLLKRLSTQLFMIFMSIVVLLSLVVTGTFVSLLFKSVETESLAKLKSNAKVSESLLKEKHLRIMSQTMQLSSDVRLIEAIAKSDRQTINQIVKKQMLDTAAASIVIVDASGKVILRGENEEERGTSLTGDKYIEKALEGSHFGGYSVTYGTVAPLVSIKLATPITGGAILVSYVLDNAFVDGIKNSTGLAISLYADKIMSATTEVVGNSSTRLVGIKEVDPKVLENVYQKGEIYAAATTLGEKEYLAAYVPLKDHDNEVVAVLQVAQPEVSVLQAAGYAVQSTFGFIILIMVVLAWPLSLISKRLVAEWE